MALTKEARIDVLNRAVQLESRSFLEYLAHTAPPYDIEKYPHAAKILREIAHEEDQVVDDLVEQIVAQGGHPDALGSYELVFSYYNYIGTEFALKALAERMKKSLAQFDPLLAAAAGDEIEPRLREIHARKVDQIARVEHLKANLKNPPPPPAPAAEHADAHGHHGAAAHHH